MNGKTVTYFGLKATLLITGLGFFSVIKEECSRMSSMIVSIEIDVSEKR